MKMIDSYICLELIPPSYENKTPRATEQLFSVLHGFGDQSVISLEVVSTRTEGIRFIAKVNKDQASSFIRAVASYLPEVKVREIPDYISSINLSKAKLVTFEQTKHWAYPLKRHSSLEENDPMSYITGSMTKLNDDEMLVYQLVYQFVNHLVYLLIQMLV